MKRIKSTDRQASFVRALNHGDSGIGKTTSILTLPADKTFVAVSERGALPLRKKAYDVGLLESWEDCRELIVEMRKEGGPPILVIDSLTECSELCKQHIVNVDRKSLMTERTGGKSQKAPGIYDDLMTMEDWNLYSSRMNGFLGAACRLPRHVIFMALSMRKENKKTGEQLVVPDVNGALAFECAAYFDLVVHMENIDTAKEDGTKVQSRIWRTANNGEVLAKDASGSLDVFEPTNWVSVFGKILGTNGNGAAKTTKKASKKTEPEEVAA